LRIDLDDAALERKLAAARYYAGLGGEVDARIDRGGLEPLRTESLRPVLPGGSLSPAGGAKPFYEVYGEKQVAAGRYASVLRLGEHMAPLARALADEN
jgi:hypothetical protein